MKKISSLIYIMVALAFFSCTDDEKDSPADNFDQTAMLNNLSSNVFIPHYSDLKQEVAELNAKWNAFKNSKSVADYTAMSEQFTSCYLSYQQINYLDLGPAANVALRNNFNTFPTDTAQINTNIQTGSYNINTLRSYPYKGFPALDYLFFREHINQLIVRLDDSNFTTYVDDILTDMVNSTSTVFSEWTNNYGNQFSSKTGSDIGSSLGMLTNAWNQHYERNFRDGKIGIPVGIRSLGLPMPEKAEAFYSGISTDLAIANLNAMEQMYLGIGKDGINRASFDDYLISAGAAELDGRIKAQFAAAKAGLEFINNGLLSDQIINNQSGVEAAYFELQKLILLIKVELPSRLGILITYQDNDGD